jgi:hypothetical protein
MESFIAFHEKRGIYIGVFAGYALFSSNNFVYTRKAIRFESADEVHEFFKTTLANIAEDIKAVPVTTTGDGVYVDVIDIIKSGHTKHTESLLDNIPMENENIH